MEKEDKRKTLELFANLPSAVRKGIAVGKALADIENETKKAAEAEAQPVGA